MGFFFAIEHVALKLTIKGEIIMLSHPIPASIAPCELRLRKTAPS